MKEINNSHLIYESWLNIAVSSSNMVQSISLSEIANISKITVGSFDTQDCTGFDTQFKKNQQPLRLSSKFLN